MMASFRNIAIKWYRRVFGAPAGSDIRDEGLVTVLAGNEAVALSESAIASHAVEIAEGPRGIVAAATGVALAGRRATAFLSGPDLAAVQDLLISAAGRHAPMVLHVAATSAAAHGGATGSGHDAVHLSADAGCFLLFAGNVQQAVDFSFIARRVSEETLVPGLVVMDAEQTALAAQDVRLLSPNQAATFLGGERDEVQSPTEAQKLLFGERRRRLPAWHDLDEPLLTGAVFDRDSFALGAAARRPFFDDFVSESLTQSCERFAGATGRHYDALSTHRVDDAEVVLVAQGAAVETATLAADVLRKQHKLRAGVVGIHALRPFPAAAVAAALEKAKGVFVLERGDAALPGEPPLTREIRASLYRSDKHPRCRTAVYGVGGRPLRLADITLLCTSDVPDVSFLGVPFDDDASDQPKRDVLYDALRRAYPDVAKAGVFAQGDIARPAQKDTLTVAIDRDRGDTPLAGTAAALLHALNGGTVRSRPGDRREWFVQGDKLVDPGDDVEADVTLDVAARTVSVRGQDRRFRLADGDPADELLLGGLFGALLKSGLLSEKSRRVIGARRNMLDTSDAELRDDTVAAFQRGLEELGELEEYTPSTTASTGERRRAEVPSAVRELGRNDDRVASLPRFWDQTGVLYREGKTGRMTADPFLATGSMPPLSATFSAEDTPAWLPAFDATACTGCGKCWTQCPDSAIGVVAAGPAALLDAGIRETGAEPVRQVAGKLAARISASNRKAESPPATFGAMLDEAFAWLMDKAPLPDDRKQAIEEGVAKIGAAFGNLPVAVTTPFFHDVEAKEKDGGELLSVVVNADACQACGICVQACEPDALQERAADAEFSAETRALWETWSATPDTSGRSLERAAEHEDVGPTAATLLSRHCQFALAGSDVGEAGSGEKAAVRLALAAIEYHQQPIVQRFANTLSEAGTDLSGLIREMLSSTLPVEDLDAVSEQLESLASPRVDLSMLAEKVAGADADHSIETSYLLRLIDLSTDIAAAHHRLVTGEHGLGRARYGLAVTGDSTTAWAARFPANPFQVPTVVDLSGDAPQLAAGLVEGHLQETTELVRLQRLARLEVEKPDGLDWKRDELARLRWQDLTDEELALCPPLLLIGNDEMLAGRGLAQLTWLLSSGLPVKMLMLSALDLAADVRNPRIGVGLLALAQRSAYVAQSSIAHADHLGESFAQALAFRGPALIQVYAPSPSRDGYDPGASIEQARLAVAARVLPLFRYDPRAEGVFGSRISLDGNPDADELGVNDWALGQGRYATHAKSAELARAAEQCEHAWQTLQELAGDVTPFTEKVEARIRAEVAAEHEAALEAQRQAAAKELAEIRDQTRADIAGKLKSRLLDMAKRGKKQ